MIQSDVTRQINDNWLDGYTIAKDLTVSSNNLTDKMTLVRLFLQFLRIETRCKIIPFNFSANNGRGGDNPSVFCGGRSEKFLPIEKNLDPIYNFAQDTRIPRTTCRLDEFFYNSKNLNCRRVRAFLHELTISF